MKPLMPSVMHAIVMVGIPGAGKSTFSSRFADTFGIPILNLPNLKEDLELNARQTARFFEIILQELSKTGQTIIIEGFADTQKERASLESVLIRLKYKPVFVWVQTDTNEALKRVTDKRYLGGALSESEFDALVDVFEPPSEKEKMVVISGRHAYPTQLKVVLKQMATDATRPKKLSPGEPRQGRVRGRETHAAPIKNIQKR